MDTCCICLDKIEKINNPYLCEHNIHDKCFKSWPKKCPLCLSKPKDSQYKITYNIKNKIQYLQRPIQNKTQSDLGNNYEKIKFNDGNWYDVEKGYYSEIKFQNRWHIVSRNFLDELNRL
tara:strand:- start:5429 stop:5785 length:357 start_codon:yes stop_codon:yes gene_type:complete